MPWYAQFGCGGGGCDRIRYMKVVLQRVSQASVDVVNELGDLDPTFDLQQIGPGFLLLVGVTDEDEQRSSRLRARAPTRSLRSR